MVHSSNDNESWRSIQNQLRNFQTPGDFEPDFANIRTFASRRRRSRVVLASSIAVATTGIVLAAATAGILNGTVDDTTSVMFADATQREPAGGPTDPTYTPTNDPLPDSTPYGRFYNSSVQQYLGLETDVVAVEYLGASLDDAVARAESEGLKWRVVIRDDVQQPIDDESFDPERINFSIIGKTGKVVSAAWG